MQLAIGVGLKNTTKSDPGDIVFEILILDKGRENHFSRVPQKIDFTENLEEITITR